MDVAALSLAVDSSDVVKATGELDKLATSSGKAGTAAVKLASDGGKVAPVMSRSAQAALAAAASVERYGASSNGAAASATRAAEAAMRSAQSASASGSAARAASAGWDMLTGKLNSNFAAINENLRALSLVPAAVNDNTAAMRANVSSLSAQRAGLQQLGYQLGDVATMFSMGARPAQIFGSQLGQTLQAVQLMTGGTSRLATFLSGPWGIAISVAAIALTPLISKLFETKDAAEETGTALQKAMQALHSSLGTMSAMSTAMTEATRERVAALAEIGRINREIDEIDRRAAAASGTRYLSQGSPAFNQRQRLVEQRSAAEDRARAVDAQMRGAMDAARVAAWQQERLSRLAGQQGPAAASRTATLSEEARALQERTRATDQYITSLTDEVARIGLSEEALRQYEVAQALSRAATDAQRESITKLSAERERALATLRRQQDLETAQRAVEAARAGITSGVDIELQTMGLVGAEREKEILRIQRQIALTDILAKIKAAEAAGNVQLADTYRQLAEATDEGFAKKIQLINGQELIDQLRQIENVKLRGLDSLNDGIVDAIMGVRSLGDVFSDVANQIIADLLRIAVQRAIIEPLSGLLGGGGMGAGMGMGMGGGGVGGVLGNLIGMGISSLFGGLFANGGAFDTAQRFAKGGTFTNSILNSPTLFRFANGGKLGVAGEAGPEAVMPLVRGPTGKLGVQAHGGGGGNAPPSIQINTPIHMAQSGSFTTRDAVSLAEQAAQAAVREVRRNLSAYLAEWDIDGSVME